MTHEKDVVRQTGMERGDTGGLQRTRINWDLTGNTWYFLHLDGPEPEVYPKMAMFIGTMMKE